MLTVLLITILTNAEKEMKSKYMAACNERRAIFTPLCMSVDGLLGRETSSFIKRLAEQLSFKWQRNYNEVVCWLRTHLTFSILRATILCLSYIHKYISSYQLSPCLIFLKIITIIIIIIIIMTTTTIIINKHRIDNNNNKTKD